jgi:hypothetical protein
MMKIYHRDTEGTEIGISRLSPSSRGRGKTALHEEKALITDY